MTHEFGGRWTDRKLEVMRAYFGAYVKALKNQPFDCWYVDAFAGTGERTEPRGNVDFDVLLDEEEIAAKDGSARIALGFDPPFRRYKFIDRSKDHIASLRALRDSHPNKSIDVVSGDANEKLIELCTQTDWKCTRAAVFIDPYGMQVSWATLVRLAQTKSVDIALLFPTGPLNRLLRRDGDIPHEWVRRIEDHLGPCEWQSAFYRKAVTTDLFNTVASTQKDVDVAGLQTFVRGRLQEIFPYVHPEAVPLKNSKGTVLYDLFIICANPSKQAVNLSKKLAKGAIKAAMRAKG